MSEYPSQTDYLEGHIESLEIQLAEAYAKIEAMKCCGNCKHWDEPENLCQESETCLPHKMRGSNKCDKWEMRK
jgi:hypothetical protein